MEGARAVTASLARDAARAGGGRPTLLHFIYGVGGGGAEAMMRGLVRGLDRRRFRVVVVAMQAAAWPEEAEELRRAVDRLHVLEETALLSGGALRKLHAVMRVERPEVVQTWMHHADFTGGVVARLAGAGRVVWGIHCREITRAPGESRWKSAVFAQLMPWAARWVPSRIVSCSQAALEDHAALGYPRGKMVWIPNGIDTQRFRPSMTARQEMRDRLGLEAGAPVVGFAGRFHEMKNLPMMLRAFGRLTAGMPQARLVLCGVRFEELDEECRGLVTGLPEAGAVRFLPFQSDPEHFYPGLDVFTLSSRTEACPMTILEAMACGVRCVTTDVGDCGRLMGGEGMVVPAGDEAGLAAGWKKQLEAGAEERAARGEAARRRVVEQFSVERAAARYEEVYETLIPRRTA